MAQLQGLGRGDLAQPDGLLPRVPFGWRLRREYHLRAAPRISMATPVPGFIPAGAADALAN